MLNYIIDLCTQNSSVCAPFVLISSYVETQGSNKLDYTDLIAQISGRLIKMMDCLIDLCAHDSLGLGLCFICLISSYALKANSIYIS